MSIAVAAHAAVRYDAAGKYPEIAMRLPADGLEGIQQRVPELEFFFSFASKGVSRDKASNDT